MDFEVVGYQPPSILVENKRTKEVHEFQVNDDGSLRDDGQTNLGDAKRKAIAYLYEARRTNGSSD
jgi:hypothetical protein